MPLPTQAAGRPIEPAASTLRLHFVVAYWAILHHLAAVVQSVIALVAGVEWGFASAAGEESVVQHIVGSADASSQSAVTEFHICPACWPKLVAWFEGQGATATRYEQEW